MKEETIIQQVWVQVALKEGTGLTQKNLYQLCSGDLKMRK